jgi:cellulase
LIVADYLQSRSLTPVQPFTVVTQFHTNDGTATGTLSNITRLYIQNNKIIQNAVVQVAGMGINSIEESFCEVVASSFQQRGGLAQMGKALERGMVLAMSIWNDPGQFMNWLDSGSAGPCNATEGNPALYVFLLICVFLILTDIWFYSIEANDPTTSVTFSDIRIGDIGSTFSAGRRGYRYYA